MYTFGVPIMHGTFLGPTYVFAPKRSWVPKYHEERAFGYYFLPIFPPQEKVVEKLCNSKLEGSVFEKASESFIAMFKGICGNVASLLFIKEGSNFDVKSKLPKNSYIEAFGATFEVSTNSFTNIYPNSVFIYGLDKDTARKIADKSVVSKILSFDNISWLLSDYEEGVDMSADILFLIEFFELLPSKTEET